MKVTIGAFGEILLEELFLPVTLWSPDVDISVCQRDGTLELTVDGFTYRYDRSMRTFRKLIKHETPDDSPAVAPGE